MTTLDPLDEEKSARLRQRLWGAAVLIALLVIFLPLVLDGSGSESQYRRVERLRAEPPRVIGADGNPEAVQIVDKPKTTELLPSTPKTAEPAKTDQTVALAPQKRVRPTPSAPVKPETLQAWVVQAGSFKEEENAVAVRDKLRRAGFPSFVTPTDADTPLFRVRVGPMISQEQAERSKDNVMRLLEREAIVVSYP